MEKRQKIGIISGIILSISIIVIIVIIFLNSSTPKVEISFDTEINIPNSEMIIIRKNLGAVIRNNTENFSDDVVYYGNARNYQEYADDDLTTATFVADFDDIEESYLVTVWWPKPDDDSPNVVISCPIFDSKYPETPCSTESNSSTDILSYLPYSGTLESGKKYEIVARYNANEIYLEIRVDSCGNLEILSSALNATREWMKKINFDPDDFLFYEPTNICSDAEKFDESFYFQANRSRTNDVAVNANLPYFVPGSVKAFPKVGNDNVVESIQIDFVGCTDYQTAATEEWILDYLKMHSIEYPMELNYCVN